MLASEYRTTRKIALWVTVSVFALAALTVAAAILLRIFNIQMTAGCAGMTEM